MTPEHTALVAQLEYFQKIETDGDGSVFGEAIAVLREQAGELKRMKASGVRDGRFLDSMWCCKVCDGEIPDGHTNDCDIWKIEKQHRDFLANEYSAVLTERDRLAGEVERLKDSSKHAWINTRTIDAERIQVIAERDTLRVELKNVKTDADKMANALKLIELGEGNPQRIATITLNLPPEKEVPSV